MGKRRNAGSVTDFLVSYFASLSTAEDDGAPRTTDLSVPCGSCNLCCRSGYDVDVDDDENHPELRTTTDKDGKRVLQKAESGACTHLVKGKCEVYEHRPAVCRGYDCRAQFFAGVGYTDNPARQRMVDQWYSVIKTNRDALYAVNLNMAARQLPSHVNTEAKTGYALSVAWMEAHAIDELAPRIADPAILRNAKTLTQPMYGKNRK